MMLGLGGDAGGGGSPLSSNPLGIVAFEILQRMGVFPAKLKRGVSNVNNMISNFLGGTLAKVRGFDFKSIIKSGGQNSEVAKGFAGFLNDLKDAILPKNNNYTKVDTGNYNKRRVDWDGIARKSLVEVIPTQLGKILEKNRSNLDIF